MDSRQQKQQQQRSLRNRAVLYNAPTRSVRIPGRRVGRPRKNPLATAAAEGSFSSVRSHERDEVRREEEQEQDDPFSEEDEDEQDSPWEEEDDLFRQDDGQYMNRDNNEEENEDDQDEEDEKYEHCLQQTRKAIKRGYRSLEDVNDMICGLRFVTIIDEWT
ncbi:hypothetical protein NPX13_g10670 [Xylaria arbuscula]|uniref:Uncharacterized protein n=1 Tax=Xylaria arbuscula TaxID=114810 RepID=A0A9W8TGJ9_9PEZI|nr:hypothetical protein NPX13_g10670 [Xylaria arbuscula]